MKDSFGLQLTRLLRALLAATKVVPLDSIKGGGEYIKEIKTVMHKT